MNAIRQLGRAGIRVSTGLGAASIFLVRILEQSWIVFRRPGLLVAQIYSVGVQTVLIIVLAGLFVGMVLGLQGYNTLVDFGAETSLGLVVAKFLTRELAPVLTALLFTGRAGSALTAEIGLMKATEQLAALEMMAVNPVQRVVAPRFIAGVISMPLLAAMFSVVGVYGGYLIGVKLLGVDAGVFWSSMQQGVDFYDDIVNGFIKSVVFGVCVTWIAVYEGYASAPNAAGISRATTATVVTGSLAVLGLDYVLTSLMFGG
ncbi:MAG: ABC transporter permease [marine bacterium B5-7]|nr:MAG: ABC transporter permease [marine bacterium B5-7]